MSEALMSAAEEVKKRALVLVQQIMHDGKMAELQKLVAGLNTLEELCGQPKTKVESLFGFTLAESPSLQIQPDEFYGLDPLEAAKQYLKKIGRSGSKSAAFLDIVAGIRSGGGDPGNEDRLRISLARSTYEVAKIGEDRYGLVEFFDHIKRERSPKKKKNGATSEAGAAPPDPNAALPNGIKELEHDGDSDADGEEDIFADVK